MHYQDDGSQTTLARTQTLKSEVVGNKHKWSQNKKLEKNGKWFMLWHPCHTCVLLEWPTTKAFLGGQSYVETKTSKLKTRLSKSGGIKGVHNKRTKHANCLVMYYNKKFKWSLLGPQIFRGVSESSFQNWTSKFPNFIFYKNLASKDGPFVLTQVN